jgi:hypothetical protein
VSSQGFAVLGVSTVVWEPNGVHDAFLVLLGREAQLKFLRLEKKHYRSRPPALRKRTNGVAQIRQRRVDMGERVRELDPFRSKL